MTINKKLFWENKIIGWEDIRYKSESKNQKSTELHKNIISSFKKVEPNTIRKPEIITDIIKRKV